MNKQSIYIGNLFPQLWKEVENYRAESLFILTDNNTHRLCLNHLNDLNILPENIIKIKAGDDIIFTNTDTGEKICATVKKLHLFASFEELYKTLTLLQCGYTAENIDTAHPSDMTQYYSVEEQQKYGVVGIELCRPKQITDETVVCLCRQQ